MDKKDFRIKEFRGRFTVQRKFTDTNWGFLWRKEVIESWKNISSGGGRSGFVLEYLYIEPIRFDSLKSARKWVNELIQGAKYYEI